MMNETAKVIVMTFRHNSGERTYTEVFREVPSDERVIQILEDYRDQALVDRDMEAYTDRCKSIFIISEKGVPELVDEDWNHVYDDEADDDDNYVNYIGISYTPLF